MIRLFHRARGGDTEEFGDIITEDLPRIFASTFDGNLAPLRDLAADPEADSWVRGAALEAHIHLAANGLIRPSDTLDYLRDLWKAGFEAESANLWCSWAQCVEHLHAGELSGEFKAAYESGKLGPDFYKPQEIEEIVSDPEKWSVWGKPVDDLYRLVDDTAEAVKWWRCFHGEGWEDEEEDGEEGDLFNDDPLESPFVRSGPKVGRNEPCPCGSGKKYKKCCGA